MFASIQISPITQALLLLILALVSLRWYGPLVRTVLKGAGVGQHIDPKSERVGIEQTNAKDTLNQHSTAVPAQEDQAKAIWLYKDLYFKLQNLERFPEILPQCRDTLILLFSETLGQALKDAKPGILSLDQYSPERLAIFLQNENSQITCEWERYISRRKVGGPVEMFKDREEAKWWLKQIAPVKYVDGAWLGHINKVTTPFALRRATKDAWQVMSEELGDGNPQMNHVFVYRNLMREIGAHLPDADNIDFIHPRHGLEEECVWKAAVAQLLISLFPHEFLPEILGFNLHFEGLTMETLKAAKELEELGFNPYYFVLHISIDNADSGHTAIAMQAVVKYMAHVSVTQGDIATQQAWRRVQAGFILSQKLSSSPTCPSRRSSALASFPSNAAEAEVIRIFRSKATVAHGIHCGSRIRFGGRNLDDWFEPTAFSTKQWQMDFLKYLGNLRPWVRKGDSERSKLVQELSWGGKMFGSFTQNEVNAVRRWIDGMQSPLPRLYWSFVGRDEVSSDDVLRKQDIRVDYPVLSPISIADLSTKQNLPFQPPASLGNNTLLATPTKPDLSILLPLWFANPCLLESFVCIPAKTTSTTSSTLVRLLRAQCGFDTEGHIVAGMDEARRVDSAGLIELGLEMLRNLGIAQPASLKEVLEIWPSEFALKMLELSMRPMANRGLLMGLASAFVPLHDAMTSSSLLSSTSRAVLTQIVRRERDCLQLCHLELKDDGSWSADFDRGYCLGKAEVGACFGQHAEPLDV